MVVSIIGGDVRFVYAANYFKNNGYDVKMFANSECNPPLSVSLEQALFADAVVLPLPACKGELVNTPLYSESLPLSQIMHHLNGKQLLFGGISKIDYPKYFNYYENKSLLFKNNQITAEGAIGVAMANTKKALADCRCLVVGYGGLGKILCDKLSALSCGVTASARKGEDFAQIHKCGYDSISTYELSKHINSFDVVFNTVPHPVILEDTLQKAKKSTLFIELASAPYGIDLKCAEKLGITALLEGSLPSRCAPESAGNCIAKTIIEILQQQYK